MGKSPRLAIDLAGDRVFCFGMLTLFLSIPCDFSVGAVTFASSGFKENSLYLVSDSSWFFDSTTGCFKFDPAAAGWGTTISGRFLYPGAVHMKDPGSTTVTSFSTSFIYQLQIQPDNCGTGPGMAFILVPDNVTIGAPLDFMGLITNATSATPKNYESDNHTLGVELDTSMNPEFNDPNNNHIGINLASMNSTYTIEPIYTLASNNTVLYQQIWIDYFEAGSRMDIYYANYKEDKPLKPQGSQSGLNLSLLKENMFIGFSTAKGIESTNVPYVCAWSFSNDGILAPPIVIAQDATPSPPPIIPSPAPNGPVAAPSLPPPASIPSPPSPDISSPPPPNISPDISSPPPPNISPDISSPSPSPSSNPPPLVATNPPPFNPPSAPPPPNAPPPLTFPPSAPPSDAPPPLTFPPSASPPSAPPPSAAPTFAPAPLLSGEPPTITRKKKKLWISVGGSVAALLFFVFVGLCIFLLRCRRRFLSRPLRIFISHTSGEDGSGKIFPTSLHDRLIKYKWSFSTLSNITFFFDKENINYGLDFPEEIFAELARSDVGLVVVTDDFFRGKWPMRELLDWKNALENDTTEKLRVLPLFYRLTPKVVTDRLRDRTWEPAWEAMREDNHPLEVDKCRDAVKWLCRRRGIEYIYSKRDHDKEYIEEICKRLDEILRQERSFPAYLWRAIKSIRVPTDCRSRMTRNPRQWDALPVI